MDEFLARVRHWAILICGLLLFFFGMGAGYYLRAAQTFTP